MCIHRTPIVRHTRTITTLMIFLFYFYVHFIIILDLWLQVMFKVQFVSELCDDWRLWAKCHSVLPSGRIGIQCLWSGRIFTQWYNRSEKPLIVTIRENWYGAKCHSVLTWGRTSMQRNATHCYHPGRTVIPCCEWSEFSLWYNREEMPHNVTIGANWHSQLPLGRICTQC